MLKSSDVPEELRPYVFHGIDFNSIKGTNITAACPFCGREKFNVTTANGFWRCVVCEEGGEGGNSSIFVREFYTYALNNMEDEKGFWNKAEKLFPGLGRDYLKKAGMCRHPLLDEPILPGYNRQGNVATIYRLIRQKDGKYRAIPTPTLGHQLFCLNEHFFTTTNQIVDICEGWKDPLAWQRVLDDLGIKDRSIVGVPGTNAFKANWCPFFSGKTVNILFDNDHPRLNEKTDSLAEPAGIAGVRRVASLLRSHSNPPAKINFLAWGGDNAGWTETLPAGTDIKDYLDYA